MTTTNEAHPSPSLLRSEPLPSCAPKSRLDDPTAPERVQKLLQSPAYRRADQDPEFLARNELRNARLQLEYQKTELLLQEQNIRSTIVLVGGTRIVEPAEARRALAALEQQKQLSPNDSRLDARIRIAQRIVQNSEYYCVARQFARLVSEASQAAESPHDFVITTGGGPGIMEAGNRGAFDVQSPSIGLNITLPMEQFPNPYVTPELCFQFRYFALRKFHFIQRAKAIVAFPGGYGTLDELFDALCLVQTRKILPIPIVLVGRAFWQQALNLQFLADEGVIAPEDMELVQYAETAQEIWEFICEWYKMAKSS